MQTWNKKLKLAIINEDDVSIAILTANVPTDFTCKDDLVEASALIKEAIKLIKSKQGKLGQEMTKLKKTKKFLNNH